MPSRPLLLESDKEEVLRVLGKAFVLHSLDIAEPSVSFDPRASLKSACLLADACWSFVQKSEDDQIPLVLDYEPISPSTHLSADLLLRFLPTVYRRAHSRDSEGHLAQKLKDILRRWPLSGVMADLTERPLIEPDFFGHVGLQMLYAERLVQLPRVTWLPRGGRAREWVEAVFFQRNLMLPVEPIKESEIA